MKYATPEERLEADRKRKREWARRNRKNKPSETYIERVSKMTEDEYSSFLKRQQEYNRKWRNNKKE